jgi:transposase
VVQDRELYAAILGIGLPWRVERVEVRTTQDEVEVFLEHDGSDLACPVCLVASPRYDTRRRSWRHLDTCQYRTLLTAEVPRVSCQEHGVHQVLVPWAEPGGRFTSLFERLAIDWLREASITAVARRLRTSWDELDGIMRRAVARGLARRKADELTELGIDETSFQKRHEYVTVITDLTRGRVLEVADDRGDESLKGFYRSLEPSQVASIRAVAMDMWRPYIRATRDLVPEAAICFDRFHVAKHLNEAVNDVRKREHRELRAEGDQRLLRTKFLWLMGPERRQALSHERRLEFVALRRASLKVGRAWAMKEAARQLWDYSSRGWATRAWKAWIGWARRSRLEPMKKAAHLVATHLEGIINAVLARVTNATAESLNSKIQRIKRTACGFRNRDRFRRAILFHCGELDLYPTLETHTLS